jgi:5-methylcytosine-specific restriction protein A
MPDQAAGRTPRVDWRYEEIVLACDLFVQNGWKGIDRRRRDQRLTELSRLLRGASPADAARYPKFRNEDGVGRKTYDLQTALEGYGGGRTKGGKTTEEVLKAFVADPEEMHQLARAIRGAMSEPAPPPDPPDLDEDPTYEEGRSFERRHFVRERDSRARKRKIAQSRRAHGYVRCEACGFDFETAYGERGRDFIECHHRNPLSVVGPSTTALRDLALLCSNCHRMIHRFRPWLTVAQLTDLMDTDRKGECAPPTPGTASSVSE